MMQVIYFTFQVIFVEHTGEPLSVYKLLIVLQTIVKFRRRKYSQTVLVV